MVLMSYMPVWSYSPVQSKHTNGGRDGHLLSHHNEILADADPFFRRTGVSPMSMMQTGRVISSSALMLLDLDKEAMTQHRMVSSQARSCSTAL